MSIRIRNHNHDCQPSHSKITRNPTTIVEKLRLQLRKPSVHTPQAKGENACHIMEPTKQRLQSSSICRFSVVFVVFPDSFPNFTRTYLLTYLLTYKALTMCSLFLRNCKHNKRLTTKETNYGKLFTTLTLTLQISGTYNCRWSVRIHLLLRDGIYSLYRLCSL